MPPIYLPVYQKKKDNEKQDILRYIITRASGDPRDPMLRDALKIK